MKKFNFTLQAVLDVDISLEKEQKNQLSIVNGRIKLLESEQMLLKSEIGNNIHIYLDKFKSSLNIDEIKAQNEYLKCLNDKILKLNVKIDEENEQKQKIQAILSETVLKRKSLEKLRDKEFKKYLKETKKEDERSIDEFALFGYTN